MTVLCWRSVMPFYLTPFSLSSSLHLVPSLLSPFLLFTFLSAHFLSAHFLSAPFLSFVIPLICRPYTWRSPNCRPLLVPLLVILLFLKIVSEFFKYRYRCFKKPDLRLSIGLYRISWLYWISQLYWISSRISVIRFWSSQISGQTNIRCIPNLKSMFTAWNDFKYWKLLSKKYIQ